MVNQHDLALARARVLLADIAPEIPDDEIVPHADLTADLGLDLVSVWALAAGLEKMAKVEIEDADIRAAHTLEDLLTHALSDVPLDLQDVAVVDDSGSDTPAGFEDSASPDADTPGDNGDLQSAMQDLANLFNS